MVGYDISGYQSETLIMYGDSSKFFSAKVMIAGIQDIDDLCNSHVVKARVWVSPIPGVQGVCFPSSRIYIGDRHSMGADYPDQCWRVQIERKMRYIQVVQALLRGHVKTEPVCLPQLHWITNTK